MKALTVAEIKNNFSDIMIKVGKGENFKVLYGKSKKPIAMIVPIENMDSPRKLGVMDNGKAKFKTIGDGKITEEEFLGL